MKYSKKNAPAGLGRIERERLSKLLRETQATISVAEAAEVLDMTREQVAKTLSRFNKKGWLKRIARGVYLPVPVASATRDIVAEEPFAIAEKLFSPCYIGGMNAANYWDLTEQIFITITVMTQKQIKDRAPKIAGTEYDIHTIKPLYFFGLETIWLSGIKIKISDPTKTILDMLMFPQFSGGPRFIADVLKNYYHSEHNDISLLLQYLKQSKNGAAIKRLGFLAEKCFSNEEELIDFCLKNLTEGNVKFSPSHKCPRLVRRWRLWIPENWSKTND